MTIRARLLILAALTVVAVPMVLVTIGCNDRPKPATKKGPVTPTVDPWDELVDTVRKDHTIEGCKNIVAQLNEMLRRENARKPSPLSQSERDLLAKQLNLTDEEIAEVARDEFSSLDAYYIEECLIFRDGLVSLDLDFADSSDTAHLERAKRAFAWAMRQVWRRDLSLPFIPPGYSLKRGSGNTPERAAVALGLFQMLGLEACLVGHVPAAAAPQLWAVGVRLGRDVYLFDPHAGAPLLKTDGKGVYTLAEVKSKPELIKTVAAQFTPKVEPADLVAASGLHLAPALSAVSPRMRFLREILNLTPPLMCGVDPSALAANFAQTGQKVAFWNPPKAQAAERRTAAFTPVLMLAYFWPPSEGGLDRARPEDMAFEAYKRDLVPNCPRPAVLTQALITGAPAERLHLYFGNRFLTAVLGDGEPRQQVLRGQFDEAAAVLVVRKEKSDVMLRKLENDSDVDKQAADWARQMSTAFAAQTRAERERPAGDPAIQDARERVELLWKNSERVVMQFERTVGPTTAADLTYQLALCKHEQAERLAHRPGADSTALQGAWNTAAGWWDSYLSKVSSQPWTAAGQIAHAKALRAEAVRLAKHSNSDK